MGTSNRNWLKNLILTIALFLIGTVSMAQEINKNFIRDSVDGNLFIMQMSDKEDVKFAYNYDEDGIFGLKDNFLVKMKLGEKYGEYQLETGKIPIKNLPVMKDAEITFAENAMWIKSLDGKVYRVALNFDNLTGEAKLVKGTAEKNAGAWGYTQDVVTAEGRIYSLVGANVRYQHIDGENLSNTKELSKVDREFKNVNSLFLKNGFMFFKTVKGEVIYRIPVLQKEQISLPTTVAMEGKTIYDLRKELGLEEVVNSEDIDGKVEGGEKGGEQGVDAGTKAGVQQLSAVAMSNKELSIYKDGPSTIKRGEKLVYRIEVKKTGNGAVNRIIVESIYNKELTNFLENIEIREEGTIGNICVITNGCDVGGKTIKVPREFKVNKNDIILEISGTVKNSVAIGTEISSNGTVQGLSGNTMITAESFSTMTVVVEETKYDYGDAPNKNTAKIGGGTYGYKTLKNENGPQHILSTVILGDRIDSETDGIPTVGADGDDKNQSINDEDGLIKVTIPGETLYDRTLNPSKTPVFALYQDNTVTLKVKRYEPIDLTKDLTVYVQMWLDGKEGNINYNFDSGSSEKIFANPKAVVIRAGDMEALLTEKFYVGPAKVGEGDTGESYLRVRVSTDSSLISNDTISAESKIPNGEVEDYGVFMRGPEIKKTTSTPSIIEGGAFNYTVEVKNPGLATLKNLNISDNINENYFESWTVICSIDGVGTSCGQTFSTTAGTQDIDTTTAVLGPQGKITYTISGTAKNSIVENGNPIATNVTDINKASVGADLATANIVITPIRLSIDKQVVAGTTDVPNPRIDYTTGKVYVKYDFVVTNLTNTNISGYTIEEKVTGSNFVTDAGLKPTAIVGASGTTVSYVSETGIATISGISFTGAGSVTKSIEAEYPLSGFPSISTTLYDVATLKDSTGVTKSSDQASVVVTLTEQLTLNKNVTIAPVVNYTTDEVTVEYEFLVTNGTNIAYTGLALSDAYTVPAGIEMKRVEVGTGATGTTGATPVLSADKKTISFGTVNVAGNATGVSLSKFKVVFNLSEFKNLLTTVTNVGTLIGTGVSETATATTTVTLTEQLELDKAVGAVSYVGGAVTMPYTFTITNGTGIAYTGLKITEASMIFSPALLAGTKTFSLVNGAAGVTINATTGEITGVNVAGNGTTTVQMKVEFSTSIVSGIETTITNVAVLYNGEIEVGRGTATTKIEILPLELRNDVFSLSQFESYKGEAGTTPSALPGTADKNRDIPVITEGESAYYFVTLINRNKFAIEVHSQVQDTVRAVEENLKTSYTSLKDANGNTLNNVFESVDLEGILFIETDTGKSLGYLPKADLTNLLSKLTENGYDFTNIDEVTREAYNIVRVPENVSLSFIIRAKLGPLSNIATATNLRTTASIPTQIKNYASLNGDMNEIQGTGLTGGLDFNLRETIIQPRPLDRDIIINKTTEKETVSVGQFVPYTIEITNNNDVAVSDVYIEDKIPAGFIFVEGSARSFLNGELDGEGTPIETTGLKLIKMGSLIVPTGKSRITYLLKVGVGVTTGTYKNFATAVKDGNYISNESIAEVRVVPDPLFDETIIIGKVFHDKNGNGIQDEEDGELGLPGVRVVTVDGINAITDAYGRYHIPEVTDEKGKNFILKVDPITLPKGAIFTTENPLVKRLGKVMMRYNFGVQFPEERVIDNGTALIVALQAPLFSPGTLELKHEVETIGAIMAKLASPEKPYSKIIVIAYVDDTAPKIYSGKEVKAMPVYTSYETATELSADRAKAVAELLREKVTIPVEVNR